MASKILPVFLPFLGCLRRCIYCNQSLITEKNLLDLESSVKIQIDDWLTRADEYDEIAFYGGTFASIGKTDRYKLYRIAKKYGFSKLRVSTAPDSISDDFLREIKEFNIATVELGVQSLSDKVLDANNRGYSADIAVSAIQSINSITTLVTQYMVGLYMETVDEFIHSTTVASTQTATYARIYPLLVLKDTPLENLYNEGTFKPLSDIETILRAVWLFINLESVNIKVIRVGLPPEVNSGEGVVAGFFHPALGDIIKSVVIFTAINNEIPIKSTVYDYKGVLKKEYFEKFDLQDGIDCYNMSEICKRVKLVYAEDYKRFAEKQNIEFIKKLLNPSNHR